MKKTPTPERVVCRVLVVDDSQDTAQALAMLLRHAGTEVDVALDGLKAIQRASFFRPDVVLLDLGLPWMHGHDVCREIRKKVSPHRPLMIAITGHDKPETRQKSMDAGFDAHLLKPVDYGELMTLVQQHCSRKTAD
jgi:two-component system OmpR family response regulator